MPKQPAFPGLRDAMKKQQTRRELLLSESEAQAPLVRAQRRTRCALGSSSGAGLAWRKCAAACLRRAVAGGLDSAAAADLGEGGAGEAVDQGCE